MLLQVPAWEQEAKFVSSQFAVRSSQFAVRSSQFAVRSSQFAAGNSISYLLSSSSLLPLCLSAPLRDQTLRLIASPVFCATFA